MGRTYLLLTATIQPPPGVPALARTDPTLRLGDYLRALRFYAALVGPVFDKVVFAENSGYDLGVLQRAVHESGSSEFVEFVSCYGLDYPTQYGRGYGEMKLVDFAMANSLTLSRLRPADTVWKCTGRYI